MIYSPFRLAENDKLTHVKAASNAGTGKRLLSTELLTGGHETGHLLLGELNLATTEGREVDVGDLVLLGGLGRHDCGCVVVVIADGDDGLDFVENTHILYMPEPFHLLSASVTRSREHMLVQSWIVDEDSRSSR